MVACTRELFVANIDVCLDLTAARAADLPKYFLEFAAMITLFYLLPA